MEDDTDPFYVKKRLGQFVRFFDTHKNSNQNRERTIQFLIIIFGASIPLINLSIANPVSNVGSAILGSLIAMLTAILQFEKYHEKWLSYKLISSKLKREYYLWKDCSGDYSKENLSFDFPSNSNDSNLGEKLKDNKKTDDKEKEEEKKYEEKKLALLVQNCEEILLAEATEYVSLFSSSKPNDNQLSRQHVNQVIKQHKISNSNSNT